MAYRFKPSDTSVQAGVRRIASGQIRKAIADIDGDRYLPVDAVHQARKCAKKLRALMRLVRPALPDFDAENARLRDAAAELSFVRDATILIDALSVLQKSYGGGLPPSAWEAIAKRLVAHREAVAADAALAEKLAVFRAVMAETGRRARKWKIEADGFAALSGGLEKTYGQAREAMAVVRDRQAADALHEWRKRVKDHWYHARLLRTIRRPAMTPHRRAAGTLGELLGEYQDLTVLHVALAGESETLGNLAEGRTLSGFIERRRRELETDAFRIGRTLFAHKPASLARSWAIYWDVWREKNGRRAKPPAA